MGKTCTFDDGSNPAVTIKAPALPETPGRSLPQIFGETTGGRHVVADYGDGTVWESRTLHFRRLSSTHFTNLRTFFETTVNWHETVFTYTDPHGTTHASMRYLSGLPQAQGGKGTTWDVDLVIAKDMSL